MSITLSNYFFRFLVLLTFVLLLPSCVSKKKMVYFSSAEAMPSDENMKNYTPVFHTDDLLSITVTALDVEAAKPFNLQNPLGTGTNGGANPPSYLIDANGVIDFPVLGSLKLAGMDRKSAIEMMKEKLLAYIKDPIINIRILNFKITVLGEVKTPGTFIIPNERITLPQALGYAGDMSLNGIRKNVLVVRDADGKKTETRVDLTSKKLFVSPVYYLNQNDVVYVEPNRAKLNSSLFNASNIGIIMSVISLVITVVILIKK